MEISVSVHDWLQLPMETRVRIKDLFQIARSQGTWVENGQVRSDGHTHQDLQKGITVEKMQAFLETDEMDFLKLFHATVAKVQNELAEQNAPEAKPDPNSVILEEWAAHLGRMESQAKSLGLTEHFELLISKFLPNAPTKTAQPSTAGQAKETKQKGAASRSTKAAKNS